MEEKDRLDYLISGLLTEMGVSLTIPADKLGKRRLLRALMNQRPPSPVEAHFLAVQDEELRLQLQEKGIVDVSQIPPCETDSRLRIWQGDITRLRVDAIVNAANSALLGCFYPLHGCIDNAIHSAAGIQLRMACQRLMEAQGYPEPVGQAKITDGYNLPAKHVIHTVGPRVIGEYPTAQQLIQLANCYRACLALAGDQGLESLAFCCLSTGEFRFPQEMAAEIAVRTVKDYLNTQNNHLKTIIFNVFTDNDFRIYRQLIP